MTQATQIERHEARCHCEECSQSIREQFNPFEMVAWSKKFANKSEPCPKCKRVIWGRGRGGYLIWACWSCNAKHAVVDKVIHGVQDRVFGFATNTEKQTVYFHLTRQTIILAMDDSEFPEMYDNSGSAIVPQKGDKIMYHELQGEKGLKALWWAFSGEFDAAIETIQARKTYRLMHRRGRKKLSRLDEMPQIIKVWEGRNLTELREKHGWRKLVEDTYEEVWFEELTAINLAGDDTDWTPCEDPR